MLFLLTDKLPNIGLTCNSGRNGGGGNAAGGGGARSDWTQAILPRTRLVGALGTVMIFPARPG